MKMKVSDYITKRIVEANITQVFTVTGGGAMHLNDSLGHENGLSCLYHHHEQACAIAAESYARIQNKMGVVCVTTGPGGTNAITGVLGGWLDSIPMFILSGQVRFDTTARSTGLPIRAMGDQEFDIVQAVGCMTKYSEMVINPMRIRYCVEKALYLAYSGRPGPVWLDIPLDVQGSYIETDELIGFSKSSYEAGGDGWVTPSPYKEKEDEEGIGEARQVLPERVNQKTVETIIEKIKHSSRPVINVGNGVRIAGAYPLFMEMVEKLGVPVVTGWNSIDCMYDEHPLYVGRAGGMGDRPGNFAIQNSDLVLSIGSRLSIRQVGYNHQTWAREAYVIVNDIDKEELRKPSIHVDLKVHADAKDLLKQMLVVLKRMKEPVFSGGEGIRGQSWVDTCKMWKKKYPVVLPKHFEPSGEPGINVYALVNVLSEALSEDQITVVGNGSACVVGGHAYVIKRGQRFISNSAVASMGYDLPAAIGAYQADQSKDIILLTGDGSIQMNLQELQTIVHHKMPIKTFLINNGGYHSIRQTQKNFFGEPLVGVGEDSFDLSFPDMQKIANAYGISYIRMESQEELKDGVFEALQKQGPVICEVMVTTNQAFEPKSSAKRLEDGTMVSPPLEDLAPFLSEEEMEENMIIKRVGK